MKAVKDSTMPSLSKALEIEVFRDILQEALSEDHPLLKIADGRICDVKYEPGKQCIILYRFKIKDSATNRRQNYFFTARVVHEMDEVSFIEKPRDSERYENLEGLWIQRPVIHFPQYSMSVYPFPSDLGLPWLIDALDPQGMKKSFSRTWAFQQQKVCKVRIKLLGYTPHMRASLLYEILVDDRVTGERLWRHLIGKTNAFKMPDRLYGGVWALWQAGKSEISMPRPEGFMMHPRLTLQQKVPGERLGRLVGAPSFRTVLRKTARAIARFHSLSIPLTTKRRLREEVRSVNRWSEVIMHIRPDLRKALDGFRSKLLAEIEGRMSMRGPVHADFHHTNVLVDNESIYLIDLDEMAYGDPCLDTGRFMASLRIPSLRTFGNIDGLQEERELFLEEYLKIRDDDVRNIRLYEAASLLTAAASAFRIQRPDWKSEVLLLFDEARRIFSLSQRGDMVAFPQAEREKPPPLEFWDRLKWAIDGTYMLIVLSRPVKEWSGADIVSCSVLKKKKIHNGWRITYALKGWSGDEKWRGKIEGLLTEKSDSRAFSQFTRLEESMRACKQGLLLPRPIASLQQIGILLIEPAQGKRLSSLLGTHDAGEAVNCLARALHRLHSMNVESGKIHTIKRELSLTRKRITALGRHLPHFREDALSLLSEIEEPIAAINDHVAPVIYSLHPEHIYFTGDRVGVDEVDKIRYAHPYLDVAQFLAQLTLQGIKENHGKDMELLSDHFRKAYWDNGGNNDRELSLFEAAALLNVVCAQFRRNDDDVIPLSLLKYARQRMMRT